MTERTHAESMAHACDNCQQTVTTASLDIDGGVEAHLCQMCWERLMAWRQKQPQGKKGRQWPVVPWPLTDKR
jgi:hypothetical protein